MRKGGQTIGLPVGPDTSRILAEVIASSIDSKISQILKIKPEDASRFVDDYTIGSNSVADAQRVIAEIRRALAGYELDISKDKTAIEPTNHLTYVGWKQYLKNSLPENNEKESFQKYFYTVHDMAKKHPHLNIEKFAIQFCTNKFLDSKDWKFIQEHLIASYRRNSTLIEPLVEIIIMRNEKHGDVEINQLRDFISSRFPILAEQQRTGEIIWLLFLVCRLKISVKSSVVLTVTRDDNPIVAILVFYAINLGLLDRKINITKWTSFASAAGLRNSMWLFAYEMSFRGWIENNNYVRNDEFYHIFEKRGVSFLDIENDSRSMMDVILERRRRDIHSFKTARTNKLGKSSTEVDEEEYFSDEY